MTAPGTTGRTLPVLLTGLVDDAVFPPAHRAHRAAAVALVLGERDPATVADQVALLPEDQGRRLRATFRSFGACTITEPLDDLLALGLVSADRPATP